MLFSAGCSKESRKQRHLAKAERYFQSGSVAEARLEYINVLQLEGTNRLALERLGTILFDQGQTHQAYSLLLAARQLNTTNLAARLKLAQLAVSMGQFQAARDEATAILEKQPTNSDAVLLLGDAIMSPEQLAQTESSVRSLQEKNGTNAASCIVLGRVALFRGDIKKAEDNFETARALEPNTPPVHLALAGLAWLKGDLTNAAVQFQAACDAAPESWANRLKLAEFKLRSGAVEDARTISDEILKKLPANVPALFCRARIAIAEQKFEEAQTYTQRILDDKVPDPEALQLHAQATLAKGDVEAAIREFEHIRDLLPKMPQTHLSLASAYARANRVPDAVASLKQALTLQPGFTEATLMLSEMSIRQKDFATATKLLGDLLAKAPKLERCYPLLAEAQRSAGAMDQAIKTCQSWQEQFPKSPQAPFFAGLLWRQQQKGDEARKAFESALAIAPNYAAATEQLIDIDLQEKKYAPAVARAQELTRQMPKSPQAWLLLAKVHLAQGASQEAESSLQKVLELDPASSAAGILLAQLYVKTNRQAEAIAKLEALIAKKPTDWTAYSLLALLQQESKEYAKARASYEQVIKLNPRSAAGYNNLAYLCAQHLKDLDAAYANAQKARDLAPDDASIADTLGWVVFQRGDYSRALTLMREAAEKLPAQPEVQFHLALAKAAMAAFNEAQASVEKALQSDAQFPGRSDAERLLWTLKLDPATASDSDSARLGKILQEGPDDVAALVKSGALAERSGNLDFAESFYARAAKASPRSIPLAVTLARFYSDRQKQPDKALEEGKRALDLAPTDPEVARLVGGLAYEGGDFRRAYTLLQDSAKQFASDPGVLFDLARASYSLGRASEADQALKQALQLNAPFSRKTEASQFAELLALAQNPAEAVKAQARIDEVLKSNPANLPALAASAVAKEQSGQFAQARDTYEQQILKRYPEFAIAWRQLAFLYAERFRDGAKALDYGQKALDSYRQDATLVGLLGRVACERKNYPLAVRVLREGLDRLPDDSDRLYYLGVACFHSGQLESSATYLRKALSLRLAPELDEEAKRLLSEIRSKER